MTSDTATLATRFRALADPVRLQVLDLLADGPMCVCDLRDALAIAGNLLSHHLKVLRKAGLVTSERDGRWVTYRLDEAAVSELAASIPGAAPRLAHT